MPYGKSNTISNFYCFIIFDSFNKFNDSIDKEHKKIAHQVKG